MACNTCAEAHAGGKLMEVTRLSICIPTKNFGAFIAETLQSIVCQAPDAIELVIVDGGSTDNTSEIVQKFQQSFPRINYVRLKQALGVDADLATAISHAKGDYCWLLSADDVVKPGAVQVILKEIDL